MKAEYNFEAGTRGVFHRPDALLTVPVYLEAEVLAAIAVEAEKRGIGIDQLVNDLLKLELKR